MHSLSLSLWVQKVLLLFLYSGTRTMHTHTLSRAHIETWTNCAHRLAHSNTSSVPRNTQLWTSHSLFVETSDSKICWSTLTAPTLHSFTHLHAVSSLSLSLSLSIYLTISAVEKSIEWVLEYSLLLHLFFFQLNNSLSVYQTSPILFTLLLLLRELPM